MNPKKLSKILDCNLNIYTYLNKKQSCYNRNNLKKRKSEGSGLYRAWLAQELI